MLDTLLSFIPIDRQHSLADCEPLRMNTRGAALFADLSGFTPLTEALVRALGSQRGAEELTRQLNLVYDALINEVDNYRGSVIGFSGDAITCWFDQDDGLRAVAAALAMQAAMSKFAAVPIPNGETVALALKAAVVGGAVKRFCVGDVDVQLIDLIAGATLDRLAETEHHAEKGQVVLDETTARELGDAIRISEWKQEHANQFAVVKGLNHPVEKQPWDHLGTDALLPEQIKCWLLPSVYARLLSGQGMFLAELRPAVSLFMRFGGIDFEAESDAPAKLDAYIKWVQSIITRYDGILVQLTIGDKGSYLYAAFGAPVAHDDDALRALRAVRELQAPPRELNYITAPQIGVSRGRMRVGPYGGTTRRTYGVLGDEVNVAARLMQAARPGQILVTERAAEATERFFEYERLEPLRVKGKSEPLRVLALRAPRAEVARTMEQDYALPIVGRVREQEVTQQSIERAASGQGQVIVLLGEAGVGKSRLAHEAMRRADLVGFEIYRGECPSYGTNSSYLVWHNILRAFLAMVENDTLDEQLAHLAQQLYDINPNLVARLPLLGAALNLPIPENDLTRSLDARVRKQLLEGMILECVRARALEMPVAFLLEDCHWLDALSYDVLEMLGVETADRAVLIVVTMRPPDLERLQMPRLLRLANTTLMSLGDFSSEEAARLIELKLQQADANGGALEPALIQKLTARAGGNPFYIEELLNYMRDRGLNLRDPHALEALDLPDSLSSLILSRIDRLTEAQRSTLKVASIIGRQFFFRWLWGVYPPLGETTAVRTNLDDMSRLDLTPLDQPDPQRSYIFRHVLTHQVTYESQPYATRAELHGRFGYFLEAQFTDEIERNVDLLAYHFDRSEEIPKRREYLLKAGEQAQAEYANDAAISYYRRLLALLADEEKIPVMLKLGQVYEVVGQWNEETVLYQEGLELATRCNDSYGDARLRAAFGTLLRKRGELADATRYLDRAQQRFEEWNDRAGIGQVLHERGTVATQQGEFEKARVFYQESLEIRRALGEQKLIGALLSNLGIIARMTGDPERSNALHNEALTLRREIGDRYGIAVSLNNLGVLKRQLGEYAQARAVLEESLAIWREIGDRAFLANTLTSLGEVLIDQGDVGAARAVLIESLNITRALGDKRAIAFLLENFARLAILENDDARALKLVAAASALRSAIGVPLPEAEQKNLDERLETARQQFGKIVVAAMWEHGKAMTMEEAVEYALSE